MREPPLEDVLLATHEAAANSIQHAGAVEGVNVRATRLADEFVVEVSDQGRWRPPRCVNDGERGRGIALMRALVSEIDIISNEHGTLVRLREPATTSRPATPASAVDSLTVAAVDETLDHDRGKCP